MTRFLSADDRYNGGFIHDHATADARVEMVPRFVASVALYTETDEPGTSTVCYWQCEHEHTTRDAAKACAAKYARKHARTSRSYR